KDGVPVLASVAAILPAMWPDLPMPVTMTRPSQASSARQASAKRASSRPSSAPMPIRSLSSVRRPVASRALSSGDRAAGWRMFRGMIARQHGNVRCAHDRAVHAMHPAQVAELIRAALPGAEVAVESPDQTHFAARIVSDSFAGLRGVARHQLVYRALG